MVTPDKADSLVQRNNDLPRVCVLGAFRTGKTQLCNALAENLNAFGHLPRDASTKKLIAGKATIKCSDEKGHLILIDTYECDDSEGSKIKFWDQISEMPLEFDYINTFLVLVDSEKPDFDSKTRNIFKDLKESFGIEVFKHVYVVYTRWDYDWKSTKARENAKVSKDSKTKELNKFINNQFGFDVEKFLIKCFFVDSESFQDPENDDQKSKKLLKEEFDSLREACMRPERLSFPTNTKVNKQEPLYEESKATRSQKTPSNCRDSDFTKTGFDMARICVLGLTGAGKSTLCNALSGTSDLFTESTGLESCTSAVRQETVKWFGKEEPFFLVDTCGFGDSQGNDDQQINDLVVLLRNLTYVNRFLIVLNSQTPRLDSQIQDMLKAFKNIFGDEVCKNISVVFTRWDYDRKSLRDRKIKSINEDVRTREINGVLRTKIGFDTERFPIDCFFVDSVSIMDAENDDEECKKTLNEEFLRMKILCWTSEKFICIDAKEYKSREAALRDVQQAIQDKKKEKDEVNTKVKKLEENDENLKSNLWQLAKHEAEEKYERQKALSRRIDSYFTDRGQSTEPSLYRDIEAILRDFDKRDTERRLSKSKFQRDLMNELNSELEPKLRRRLAEMIKQEVNTFMNIYKRFSVNSKLFTDDWIEKLDLEALSYKSLAKGAVLIASAMGITILEIAGVSGLVSTLGVVLIPLFVIGGAALMIASWKREDVIKKLVPLATDQISQKSKLRATFLEIAEKSFDFAADQISTQSRKEIIENYNKKW